MNIVQKALGLARGAVQAKAAPAAEGPPADETASSACAARNRHAAAVASLLPARVEELGYALVGRSDPIFSAQFRNIRHQLLEMLGEQAAVGASLISVSSAVPGEGKSFTSLNLCLSLAAHPRTCVTLIDFDQARYQMTQLFDFGGRPGLVDALNAPASFADFRYRTNVANLWFMPIGTSPMGNVELLSSQVVETMAAAMREPRELREPRERYFYVFDCPPMLANEDAKYMSQRSDLSLIVVKADSTPRAWTVDAIDKAGPASRVALILNNRVSSFAEQHYGYGETLKDYLGSR